MFDRGEQVTECLWLIYSLEEKAKAVGGYVHFVLGNHEIMNLQGDFRYVQEKYKITAQVMARPYYNCTLLIRNLKVASYQECGSEDRRLIICTRRILFQDQPILTYYRRYQQTGEAFITLTLRETMAMQT